MGKFYKYLVYTQHKELKNTVTVCKVVTLVDAIRIVDYFNNDTNTIKSYIVYKYKKLD